MTRTLLHEKGAAAALSSQLSAEPNIHPNNIIDRVHIVGEDLLVGSCL